MRRPARPVPFRPTMASAPRLPSVPPRMCYEGRARPAGAQGHRHGVHGLPLPAPPAPSERARDPKRRRHYAGGAYPVTRRLDTTHHPATSTKRPQTCYPHCPATPCPLVHPETQCTGDRCTTFRHGDQGTPRTCWHCGPAAVDTPWPLLHLISTHYHTPTAAATADQQAWLSPWFHTVPPDHPAHVASTRTPTAT